VSDYNVAVEFLGINAIALSGIFVALATGVIGAAMFILGRQRDHYLWGLFCITVCIWSACFFVIAQTTDPSVALWWWRISHIGVILIPIIFLHFSLEFIGKKTSIFVLGLYAAGGLWVYADLATDLLIRNVRFVFGQFYYDSPPGPLYFLLTLFFLVLVIYAHVLVYRAYRVSSDALFRARALYFFLATSIGFAGGLVTFLPVYAIDIYPITLLVVAVAPALIGTAILRYRLFDIRVVTAQFLTLILATFSLFRLVISISNQELILNSVLLFVTVLTGLYLIRSVKREVEQRERIEKLSEEKSEFMSFASHEIRNPITAMRGYASLIFDGTTGQVSDETKTAAETILVTGNQVLMLISQFLDKSKLELGQIQFAKEQFDLGKAVSAVVDGFVPSASQHHLALTKNVAFESLTVVADETKLKEIVGNLIDNSIKYTQSGGVTVTVDKHNGMGRVTISDTGVGIPKDVMPHLFQKFSRADAKKLNLRGTGLGLYLAKQFIEGMGGKIWAESGGEGEGSHFIIEVPAA
jgi:signal transduction histidine kinase